MHGRCVVGVDLGGTNVRAALIGDGRQRGPRVELPSRARENPEACIAAVAEAIEQARAGSDSEPMGVGIAVPGHVDGGMVRWAPNFGEFVNGEFRCWRDVALTAPLKERTGLSVQMGNDANLAAVGEYCFGSGAGSANGLVLFTLGTGVGSGVVLGRAGVQAGLSLPSAVIGNRGGAVELGHTVIQADGEQCSCGARGCLEAYCGAAGLVRQAQALLSGRGAESAYAAGGAITPKSLAQAAEAGDAVAKEAWRRYGFYLGVGVANAINAFAPEIVAVGGQIAKAAGLFLDTAIEVASKNAIPSIYENTRILRAEQIDDAGILGAAALALEALD